MKGLSAHRALFHLYSGKALNQFSYRQMDRWTLSTCTLKFARVNCKNIIKWYSMRVFVQESETNDGNGGFPKNHFELYAYHDQYTEITAS